MTYQGYRLNESHWVAGDEWGGSWHYFEFGPDGFPRRQVEVYDRGVTLRYGPGHESDEFGCLLGRSDDEIADISDEIISLTAQEFEAVWQSAGANATDH